MAPENTVLLPAAAEAVASQADVSEPGAPLLPPAARS